MPTLPSVHTAAARSGLTLIETLVAITLLSVGLVALLSVAATSVRSLSESRHMQRRAARLHSRLELLRARASATGCAAPVTGGESGRPVAGTSTEYITLRVVETDVVGRRVRTDTAELVLPCD